MAGHCWVQLCRQVLQLGQAAVAVAEGQQLEQEVLRRRMVLSSWRLMVLLELSAGQKSVPTVQSSLALSKVLFGKKKRHNCNDFRSQNSPQNAPQHMTMATEKDYG